MHLFLNIILFKHFYKTFTFKRHLFLKYNIIKNFYNINIQIGFIHNHIMNFFIYLMIFMNSFLLSYLRSININLNFFLRFLQIDYHNIIKSNYFNYKLNFFSFR